MQYYLKRFEDGCEFSPVGIKGIDPLKISQGFEVVNELPKDLLNTLPGGVDYIEPVDPRDLKIAELEARLVTLEIKELPIAESK